MNKPAKACKATLYCKATATLKKVVAEELEKEDKPLQDLLDEKQPENEK
jgi:hypothetical protein